MGITTQCPNCHSMNVYHKGILVVDMDEVELFFTCRKCRHEWKDTFELGRRIKTAVLQQGNKSRKHRNKSDATKPSALSSEVVVDAVQWNGKNADEIIDFAKGKATWYFNHDCMMISTLEGRIEALIGDWIIRGVNGEYYLCKPDVFTKTYEPVSED